MSLNVDDHIGSDQIESIIYGNILVLLTIYEK